MHFKPQEITAEETQLVRKIARKVFIQYGPTCGGDQLTREDLFHEGIMGLLEARANYDQTKPVPWLHFAAFRIRGAMIDSLRKLPVIRLPQEVRKKVKTIQAASRQLTSTTGDNTPEALASHLGWTLEEVLEVEQLSPSLSSIRESDDEDETNLGVYLVENNTPDPEAATSQKQTAALVQECLSKIPKEQDRLILLGRIVEGLKLRELSEMLGCSLENIRLMQKKVEKWMRECLEQTIPHNIQPAGGENHDKP